MTLAEFFERSYLPAHHLESSTAAYYRKYIRRFDGWLERPAVLGDLHDKTVKRFFAAVPRSRGAIAPLWRYAVTTGELRSEESLHVLKPRRVHGTLGPWSKAEFAAILVAARNATGVDRATGIASADYWLALVRVAHETKRNYYDLMTLTYAESQAVPLSRACREAIARLQPERRPTILGYGLSRSTFQNLRYANLRRLVRAAIRRPRAERESEPVTASFSTLLNSIDD